MIKSQLLILALIVSLSSFSHDLIKYYNGEIKLSQTEIIALCEEVKTSNPSSYLMALANYQWAVIHDEQEPFKGYEAYDQALTYLLMADTTDIYLESAILRNQGIILKEYWLLKAAIKKQEEALPLSYRYSRRRGISTKYNLGWTLAYQDPEKALRIFLEVLEEAKELGLNDRQARVYNEIGLMFTRSAEYEDALLYFKKAASLAEGKRVKADIIHNTSSLYFYKKEYARQEDLLQQSLALRTNKNRFQALRDLGECYLQQNKKSKALAVLKEAERYYDSQLPLENNIKIFEWLISATGDSIKYSYIGLTEYKKLAEQTKKFEGLLKVQAMQNLLLRLNTEKVRRAQIAIYQIWVATGFGLALLIYMVWRYRRYQLRNRVEKELVDLKIVERQEKPK